MAAFERMFMRLHQFLYIHTDGRVGHRMIMVPTLLLRTTGRRTGAARTNALIYARDGRDFVLVGSNWGGRRSPAWLYNLQANPSVEIQVGRSRLPSVGRVVAEGDADYERLWKLVNDSNHGRYDQYQAHTARSIPLVVIRTTEPDGRA